MSDDLVKKLRQSWNTEKSIISQTNGWMKEREQAADRIEKLELALEVYKRERDRYRHNKPEITGEYFLTGGQGDIDNNYLPEYVRICPAYGCAWEQLYVKTDRTVSYEGG